MTKTAVTIRHFPTRAATALVAGAMTIAMIVPIPTATSAATARFASVQQDNLVQALEVGKSYERDIRSNDKHSYRLKLPSNQFVRIAIEPQRVAHVSVVLLGPNRAKLDQFDLVTDSPLREPVAFIADISGVYTLEIRTSGDSAVSGRYRIEVEELRAADARDRNRIAAERAFAQGARLQFLPGDANSVRMAITKYQESLGLFQSIADRAGESRALGSLGNSFTSLNESRQAIEYFQKRLELVRDAKDRQQEAYMLETIGWLFYDGLRDKQRSLELLGQALKAYRDIGRRESEARTLTALGKVYADLGETPDEQRKAIDFHAEAMAIYRVTKNPYYEGDALGNLMSVWKALKVPRRAIFFGKQAVNTFQEIRVNIKELEKETQQTFLKSKEQTYRELADLLIGEGRLDEAQQVLGMLKEEEYFEFIRRDGDETSSVTRRATPTPEEVEWDKRYREIAGTLTTRGRERGELLKKQSRTPDEELRLSKLEEDLAFSYQAFQKFLDQLSGEMGNTVATKDRIFQLQEAQGLMEDLRELGSGAVAIYTLVGETKYRVILITPDVQRGFEYEISASDLARKVAAFREVVEDPRVDPLPLAKELYKILIGPVEKDLKEAGAQTLMWSLDGVLRYVPMAALHDGEKYMVERYRNVVFTPASQSRLKDLPTSNWRGLGFGVSKAHGGMNALPAVPSELRSIIQDAASGGATPGVLPGKIFLDEAFTEDVIKTMLRQRYPVVHIASHFMFQPGNELGSFLLLGDGQRLSISKIKIALNFGGVDLLTLSACDTATGGPGADGKEVEGFAVLAQRSGAKSVVATLWPVADLSTQLLMRDFYGFRDTRAGISKAEALRQAQLVLLTGTSTLSSEEIDRRGVRVGKDRDGTVTLSFRHPYFWAPFMLIGNWR